MRKKIKKSLGIFLCIVLVLAVFAGCGSKKESKEGSASNNEPVKIRLMNRINTDVKVENNPYFKEVEKLANVKLEIEAPPINNYNDRLQIVMASGDLPDLVYIWSLDKNYEQWASEGLLIPLDDKINKYPNLMANITKDMWETTRTTSTKKIHGVPKPNKVNRWGYIANQEWLDKLGLKAPSTADELYLVGKEIAAKDPDGNGKADTFAISPFGLWNDFWITSAFGLNNIKGAKDIDGQYKVKEKFQGYYPYLTFMRKLYSEKVIDPEFFMNKVYNDREKFLQKRVAFYNAHDSNLVNELETPGIPNSMSFNPLLANQNGEAINGVTPAVWGAWAITNAAKDVDGILKFLDWGNSQEGFIFMNTGIKGTHYDEYNFEKRSLKASAEQVAKAKSDFSSYTSIAYAYKGLVAAIGNTPEKAERYNKDLENYLKKTKEINIPSVKAPKLDLFGADNPDLVKKKDEMETKYVTGEISLDALKAFIDNEYLPRIADAEKEYIEIMNNLK